jgi:hypothetical protein
MFMFLESLTMAFIIVVLFEFILALWIYLVQCGRSTYSDSSDGSKDMVMWYPSFFFRFEPHYDKTNIMGLRPAWFQTSLHLSAI